MREKREGVGTNFLPQILQHPSQSPIQPGSLYQLLAIPSKCSQSRALHGAYVQPVRAHTPLSGGRLALKNLAGCAACGSVKSVLAVSLESHCRRRCASVPALILSLVDGGD